MLIYNVPSANNMSIFRLITKLSRDLSISFIYKTKLISEV